MLALGIVGPFGLTLNGQQLVDDAHFFRAAAASVFARGNRGSVLQFSVQRLLSGERAAEAFALTHAGSVPTGGLLTIVCGPTGDEQTVYLEDCAVESVQIVECRGLAVRVQYTIKGGLFITDVPPEIPGAADPGEEFIVMRRGKVSIASGVEEKAVVFSSPLSAVPIVSAVVSRPTGGANVRCTLREDSVTINGFTVDLSAATPDANYKLHYIAVE